MIKKKSSVSLVIPLYNNEKTAVKLLQKCEKELQKICDNFEIIVCDDKSQDNSKNVVVRNFGDNSRFKLFFHQKNKGIAKTLKDLYKKTTKEYIALFSVDGDWNPSDVRNLVTVAYKHDADIVIGKRTYTHYSLYRKIVSFFYNFLPILFFGVWTEDAGSIKVFKRSLYQSTPLKSSSVFFEAEFIIRAKKLGKIVLSTPINFRKLSKKGSGGKIALIFQSTVDLVKLRLRF